MIEFTHTLLDTASYSGRESEMADAISKHPGDAWFVPYGPITFDGPIDWRITSKGERVHIPLVPYLTFADPTLAMAFMIQLGFRCCDDFTREGVKRLHIAAGRPPNTVINGNQQAIQYYVGFGVVLR